MVSEATVVDVMSKSSMIWCRRLWYMSKQEPKVPLDKYFFFFSLKFIEFDFGGISTCTVRSNDALVVTHMILLRLL